MGVKPDPPTAAACSPDERKANSMDGLKEVLQRIEELRNTRPETSPIWLAKRKLAAELRRFGNTLCDSDATEAEILELAGFIAEKADFLEGPQRSEQSEGAISSFAPLARGSAIRLWLLANS